MGGKIHVWPDLYGIERATFLIDAKGDIVYIWPKVKVSGHVDAVLAQAQALGGAA